MRRWLIFLGLVAALGLFCINASAQIVQPVNVGNRTGWCYDLMRNTDFKNFVKPLVQCFTDTNPAHTGIIPEVTGRFLINMNLRYLPMVSLMFVFAIAWFGFKLMMGDVQRAKGETLTLGLKMAGVVFFMSNAPEIYTDMISILQDLSYKVSDIPYLAHTGFCAMPVPNYNSSANSEWQNAMWDRWDCIFHYILGLDTSLAESGVASFLLLMVFSMGTGILVFFFFLYLIIALICAVFRFIHIYLMAMLSLSFMFCFGYLFVPLLIFRNTFDYFKKWLSLVFGFVLTPVIMFAFMSMMLVALDVALFTGKYSVWCVIGPADSCGNAAAGASLFSGLTKNTVAGVDKSGSNPNLENAFKTVFSMALDGPQSVMAQNPNPLIEPKPILPVNPATGSYKCDETSAGWTGYMCLLKTKNGLAINGSTYQATEHPALADVGLEQAALNLQELASKAGRTPEERVCTKSNPPAPQYAGKSAPGNSGYYNNCPYIERILISVAVAALLVYIMIALLSYIPTLASNMTAGIMAQDIISSGGRMLKTQVLGESQAMGALGSARQGALNAASGMQGGARNIAGMMASDRE